MILSSRFFVPGVEGPSGDIEVVGIVTNPVPSTLWPTEVVTHNTYYLGMTVLSVFYVKNFQTK